MTNLQLKEVAKEATNKDFYNQFATANVVTAVIGYFGQFISALTEFHFIFVAGGGVYQWNFTLKNIVATLAGLAAVYIFEVIGVRVYLVRIIRQIVNKDFVGSERKILFAFNMLFVLALCGSNLLLSALGQMFSFKQVTNVVTTDKTHQIEKDRSAKLEAITTDYNAKESELKASYNNTVATVTARYDNDVKELKNSRYTVRDDQTKYDNYTAQIDAKLNDKATELKDLNTQFLTDKKDLKGNYDYTYSITNKFFKNRLKDVSGVENSKVEIWKTVEKYTLPLLIIFILLSWFAIVYNEIFLKGSEQKIEVIEVEKRPVLILELLTGLYEKFYQMFYYLVAKFLGSKKYEFGAIKQDVVKYDIKNAALKNTSENGYNVAAKVRQIGFNRNRSDNQNDNQNGTNANALNHSDNQSNNQNDNQFLGANTTPTDNQTTQNLTANDYRITKVVTVENSHNRTCKNCGGGFTYKHHKQVYCSEKCRISSWENRTGKQLKKKLKR